MKFKGKVGKVLTKYHHSVKQTEGENRFTTINVLAVLTKTNMAVRRVTFGNWKLEIEWVKSGNCWKLFHKRFVVIVFWLPIDKLFGLERKNISSKIFRYHRGYS